MRAATADRAGHPRRPLRHRPPATGRRLVRLLAAPQQAAALLGWGEQGFQQAQQATEVAHQRWGIPLSAPTTITELPAEGGLG